MALIKIQGNTKIQGKTIFSGGPTAASAAEAYIAAVEAADGQSLEAGVASAYTSFIAGLWADGLWEDLKAACILAGARTLNGALIPLVGTAPTNNNFVSGDYNRETGLIGNGSTKYLNANRASNADPQNDFHMGLYVSQAASASNKAYMGTFDGSNSSNYVLDLISTAIGFTVRGGSVLANTGYGTTGFLGMKRNSASQGVYRLSGSDTTVSNVSRPPSSLDIYVHGRNRTGVGPQILSDGRIAFYSIGESLDLALLDSRVSTLMTDIAAAI